MSKIVYLDEVFTNNNTEYLKNVWGVDVNDEEFIKVRDKYRKIKKILENSIAKFKYYYKYEFTFDIICDDIVIGEFTLGGSTDYIYKLDIYCEQPLEDLLNLNNEDVVRSIIDALESLGKTIYLPYGNFLQSIEFNNNLKLD